MSTVTEIKAAIARDVGEVVRCSIGIGPNWFVAKLASDICKPDGLLVIGADELPAKLPNLVFTGSWQSRAPRSNVLWLCCRNSCRQRG